MNNDWLKGYISALENVKSFCEVNKTSTSYETAMTYNQVIEFINNVKDNYKELVRNLNETQSKKTE